MSNSLAIAATTATLQSLLGQVARVDLLSPDNAGKASGDRVNLFLYQTAIDAAWRNQDMPGRVRPGETALPPLPLNLYYLLTAYSADPENEIQSQALFGQAMRVLHDHPVLGADEIRNASSAPLVLQGSDLDQQVERLRIVFQVLSTDDISKLWMAFQTPYRLSAAYLVSVVLIESQRGIKASLPVLSRGDGDRGPTVVSGGLPLLTAVRPVLPLPAVRLGEDLALTGERLTEGTLAVTLRGPLGSGPFVLTPTPAGPGKIVVTLPGTAGPAGIYTAQVTASRTGEPDRSSGELPFPLAPRITLGPLALGVLEVNTITPKVQFGQRVSLLVGEIEVAPNDLPKKAQPQDPTPLPTGILHFPLTNVPAGTYVVRLRVDGVDSIPLDLSTSPPQFANDQKVTI